MKLDYYLLESIYIAYRVKRSCIVNIILFNFVLYHCMVLLRKQKY